MTTAVATIDSVTKGRKLTEKQEKFLEALFGEAELNIAAAMRMAGYHPGGQTGVTRSLKDEIIEGTKIYLAAHAPKAAKRLIDGLDATKETEVNYDVRLRTAQDILDRNAISRKTEVQHTGEVVHGVVLLPPKEN